MQTFIAKLCISESKITGINKGLKSVYGGASTIYEWQIYWNFFCYSITKIFILIRTSIIKENKIQFFKLKEKSLFKKKLLLKNI